MVRWDNEASDTPATSRSIKLVEAAAGLTPGAQASSATDGGEGDDENNADSISGSESDDDDQHAAPESANIHVERSNAYDTKLAGLVGTTITVTYFVLVCVIEYETYYLVIGRKRKSPHRMDDCPIDGRSRRVS